MLFSDWDRSGRRDLRVSNDRQYYDQDGEEQLWRIAPGEAPRLYTAADGWVRSRSRGWASRSYDVTGDGYPEVYLTSQGDNRLQTLAAGPSEPTYQRHRPSSAASTRPAVHRWRRAAVDRLAPEFEDVNNDGFIDLFVSKGNVSEQPDYAMKDPSNLLLGQPDGTFVEGAEAAGIAQLRARARGGPGRLQPRRPARPRRGQLRDTGRALAERRVRATPRRRRRWATGSALRVDPARPEPRRDRRLDRGPTVGDGTAAAAS